MAKIDKALLKEAYSRVFGTSPTSLGKIMTGSLEAPVTLIAESVQEVVYYIRESIHRRKFVPICVGSPGSPEEVIRSLSQHGVWVGNDVADRTTILAGVAAARKCCNQVRKDLLPKLFEE